MHFPVFGSFRFITGDLGDDFHFVIYLDQYALQLKLPQIITSTQPLVLTGRMKNAQV